MAVSVGKLCLNCIRCIRYHFLLEVELWILSAVRLSTYGRVLNQRLLVRRKLPLATAPLGRVGSHCTEVGVVCKNYAHNCQTADSLNQPYLVETDFFSFQSHLRSPKVYFLYNGDARR